MHQSETDSKWQVQRVRLNNGGYDRNGSYWGNDIPLYICFNDSLCHHFRADDRAHAIEQLRDTYKGSEISLVRG